MLSVLVLSVLVLSVLVLNAWFPPSHDWRVELA